MDRWRYLSRPAGRRGARRAGVTALAVLIVTATLAVLLAVRYRLAWPSVVVSILGSVPALYLTWLAVPGVISTSDLSVVKKLAYGRLARRWTPAQLGSRVPSDRRRAAADLRPSAAR